MDECVNLTFHIVKMLIFSSDWMVIFSEQFRSGPAKMLFSREFEICDSQNSSLWTIQSVDSRGNYSMLFEGVTEINDLDASSSFRCNEWPDRQWERISVQQRVNWLECVIHNFAFSTWDNWITAFSILHDHCPKGSWGNVLNE